MRTRAAVVTASLLLGLLAPAVPASAAQRVTVSGRVLDETGRGVASATVWFTAELYQPPVPAKRRPEGLVDGFFWALGCALSFGFACGNGTEAVTRAVRVTARTDGHGRYVVRFEPGWQVRDQVFRDVKATRPALIAGTVPPRTTTTFSYRGGRTLPNVRLWLRGGSAEKVTTTRRRLGAAVPKVLGTPVDPPTVVLVQGTGTAWSYGAVPRARTVDARVAEQGTTGTQTSVTTRIGSRYVTYLSGVRPVTKAMRPLSRGKRCYEHSLALQEDLRDCPLTDGRLALRSVGASGARQMVVDLGRLSTPEAYVLRGCDTLRVATSAEGVVFLDVGLQETEPGVYTGKPALPARYVRLDLGTCWPAEASVFGTWWQAPVPPAPAPVPGAVAGTGPLP